MKKRCPTCGHPIGDYPTDARVMNWMLRHLRLHPDGVTRRDLTNACAYRDRRVLSVVITTALADGSIRELENRFVAAS